MRGHFWVIAAIFTTILSCGTSISEPSDDQKPSNISIEIILKQLRNDQPVIYDHAIIVGNLILDSSGTEIDRQAQKFVNSSIIITNSTFRGNINLDRMLLKKPVIVERCIIEGYVSFRNTSFLDISRFNLTTFQKEADFEQAKFYQDAIFRNSSFQGEGNFIGSTFTKEANFDEGKFEVAQFTDCQFNGYSRFGKAIFKELANFEGSRFSNGASFNQAQFNGKTFFGWIEFHGKTYFRESDFRDACSFSGSSFDDVYFNGANFAEEATFLNSSFNGNVKFVGTRFQKDTIFYRANFSSNIDLYGCDYRKLVLHWNKIREHIKPDDTIFNNLIQNYKGLIWISDVNECYFDYRHWKQSAKPWIDMTKIPDIFLGWYCGYGTKPLNTIYWIGFIVIIFGIYYWSKGGVKQIIKPDLSEEGFLITAKKVSEDTFRIERIQEETHEKLSNYRSFLLSLKFSLFVLANKNTDNFKTNQDIRPQIETLQGWIGKGLFLIFMYYVGSVVISYFTPQP